MAKIIEESKYVTETWYERTFEFEGSPNCGYSFDCDKDGNLSKELCDAAIDNYKRCLKGGIEWNGKKLIDKGIIQRKQTYRQPAQLKCNCGEIIPLVNEYMGACSCPVCEQWYSLSGQELLPPKMWEEDF